jgi:hypothetical protein
MVQNSDANWTYQRFDEYSSKFSLSYETKVINPVEKSQTQEGDAC